MRRPRFKAIGLQDEMDQELGTELPQPPAVIPAKAGTQLSAGAGGEMGPSFRWDDTGLEVLPVGHRRAWGRDR
ncbi:hypothetical protein ASC68_27515 [Devosia sp. Root105]|nr:hypothetical protein ASC68_27515 [Devosia sp. Root105]